MPNTQNFSIVLFDGVCNFCNSSVNFIILRDRKMRFRFMPLQSEAARALCEKVGVNPLESNTFILFENGRIYERSSAALRIAKNLSGLWPGLYVFWLVPRFIRDAVYSIIARNRYKWFGRRESCMVPTAELKSRFIIDNS